jgi:predicted AAA+ superfamily ATPase
MIIAAIQQHKIERDRTLTAATIPRELLKKTLPQMESALVKVITGPRRAGKSVFAFQLLKGREFGYVNFDDERLTGVADFDELMRSVVAVYGAVTTLLLDEIQNVPSWELIVNRLQRQGYSLVITGSNAHLLSRELGTHLTGRYLEFRLLPFSFREYLTAKEADPVDEPMVYHHFTAWLHTGGYPEVVVNNTPLETYLPTLFDSILFKDIVRRYRVKYPQKIHELAHYITTNHSCEYTCNALKGALGFRSVHTVENYVSYLAESFLFFPVERYSTKLKELLKAPRKAYAIDLGMIEAIKFKQQPDTGRLLENAVAIELFRQGSNFYTYKTAAGKETDFVVRTGITTSELIQVTLDTTAPKTLKRELTGILAASRDLLCTRLTILTGNETWEKEVDGMIVRAMPVWKWLLLKEA